jgi:tetratricopeptide (TPR) repeat protein
MFIRLLLILALSLGFSEDGDKDGRRGNVLYENGQFENAADAYYAGLEAYAENETGATFYGLQNNLGAALNKQGQFDIARGAFAKAMENAPSQANFARSAYNAGNNEFQAQQLEAALENYKKALLADPTNADAKFNYEFAKRQLEQQQQQEQQQGDSEQDQQEQDQQEQNQDGDQQQQDQEQQEQQEGEQEQEQNGDQQQDQQEQQEQDQQQQQPQPDDSEQLSRQQAERILQALENEEEELLREVQKVKGRPRRVEKDW